MSVAGPELMMQLGPKAVCRRRPRARCSGWNRPRIRNGFLHYVAVVVSGILAHHTPWFELRYLLDDHVPATGEERERGVREDFLKNIALVISALLARMDLKSLRVGHHAGRHRKHDFVGLTVETIAGWTRLSESTVSRVLTLLRESGLVHGPGRDGVHHINQPCDRLADGSYEWHPAIRQFSELFFIGLGKDIVRQLHELRTRSPDPAPDRGVSQAQAVGRKADQARVAREARLAALARPPDG